MVRKIGKKRTFRILELYRRYKDYIRKIVKLILFPVVLYRRWQSKKRLITNDYLDRIENTKQSIIDNSNKKYIVFYNNNYYKILEFHCLAQLLVHSENYI